MKTIRQHYEEDLPADIAAMAIRNAEESNSGCCVLDTKVESLTKALCMGFVWDMTDQGKAFWYEVNQGNYGDATQPIDYDLVCDEMIKNGGSFAAAIAVAFYHADSGNRNIIKREWRGLFAHYGKAVAK